MTPTTAAVASAASVGVSFRLHHNGSTIVRGPLALVAAQAWLSARSGIPLRVTDHTGSTVLVTRSETGIIVIWEQPLELFPRTGHTQSPGWADRVTALVTGLDTAPTIAT